MHSLTRADEPMLRRLRSATRIDLKHPTTRPVEEVRSLWSDYLRRRGRAHVVALSYNAIIAPVALALLWPLPGPNLIGYWFAYRAVHHWLVVSGIRAVRSGRTVTHTHADARLDQPVERDAGGTARHEAVNGKCDHLEDYVKLASVPRTQGESARSPQEPHDARP